MKKWIVALLAVVMWPLLWAGTSDNLIITSGTTTLSTLDTGAVWSADTTRGINVTLPATANYFRLTANAQEVQKRYVSIWIIDQDENVPLNQSLLYEQKMIFSDKNPDEIRAGIPLLKILDTHNEVRGGLKDKDGKPLKKVRLRDLQIVIRNW